MFVRKDRGEKESYVQLFKDKSWWEKFVILMTPCLIIYILLVMFSCYAQ